MRNLNIINHNILSLIISLSLVACDSGVKVDNEAESKPNTKVNQETETKKTATDSVDTENSTTDTTLVENNTQAKKGTVIEHYTVYDNGTAVDNETGMMWARCSIGQEWDKVISTCTGNAEKMPWDKAVQAVHTLNEQNYLGYSDWQLPHVEDLHNLIYCSTGFKDTKTIPTTTGGEKEVPDYCKGEDYQQPTLNNTVFPNAKAWFHWSSLTSADNKNSAWGVSFYYGYGYANNKVSDNVVRAVRAK